MEWGTGVAFAGLRESGRKRGRRRQARAGLHPAVGVVHQDCPRFTLTHSHSELPCRAEGLSLHQLSSTAEERPLGGLPSARLPGGVQPSARYSGHQPAVAAQYQQQARYVVPPMQQYPHAGHFTGPEAFVASGSAVLVQASSSSSIYQPLQQQEMQQQQQPQQSARGFLRLPQFLGGSSGSGTGSQTSRPAPASARTVGASRQPFINPYLQVRLVHGLLL